MNIDDYIEGIEKQNGFINKIGIKYVSYGEGAAVGRIYVDETSLNPLGGVHGGCMFALADTIAGTAAMTRGYYVTTVSSSIEYLNPGKDVKYIEATATEIKNGRTICVYDVMVRDDKGKDIVKMTLSYFKLRKM